MIRTPGIPAAVRRLTPGDPPPPRSPKLWANTSTSIRSPKRATKRLRTSRLAVVQRHSGCTAMTNNGRSVCLQRWSVGGMLEGATWDSPAPYSRRSMSHPLAPRSASQIHAITPPPTSRRTLGGAAKRFRNSCIILSNRPSSLAASHIGRFFAPFKVGILPIAAWRREWMRDAMSSRPSKPHGPSCISPKGKELRRQQPHCQHEILSASVGPRPAPADLECLGRPSIRTVATTRPLHLRGGLRRDSHSPPASIWLRWNKPCSRSGHADNKSKAVNA